MWCQTAQKTERRSRHSSSWSGSATNVHVAVEVIKSMSRLVATMLAQLLVVIVAVVRSSVVLAAKGTDSCRAGTVTAAAAGRGDRFD
ncbi:hypothetical protein LA080_005736 [Diaporthe eres]|nr:hypothetical protein LA080_005736 [Diaporthe eres]